MAGNVDSSGRRIEGAILLVGGLVLFLLGLQSLAGTGLSFYDTLSAGSVPRANAPFWVDNSAESFLGLLFVLAGLFLLFLAWRARRS